MTPACVRMPAVAGPFYPEDPEELRSRIHEYIDGAVATGLARPRAVIAPHAGYIYSGPVAGAVFALVRQYADSYRRVVLVGPSHSVYFEDLAATDHTAYRTPLGDAPIDSALNEHLLKHPAVRVKREAHSPELMGHRPEHNLEVHVPFIQTVLPDCPIVPLLIGQTDYTTVADALEGIAEQEDTLLIVSTDLSHFHTYEDARFLDEQASRSILALDPEGIGEENACGRIGIGALLLLAQRYRWIPHQLDLRSSGDTAGPRNEVVGYGAFAFTAKESGP